MGPALRSAPMINMTGTGRTRHAVKVAGAAAGLVMVLGACSSDDDAKKVDESTASTAGAATDGTTDPSDGTVADDAWTADAYAHRGADGETFDYECTPDGTLDTVWGAGIYTDDSSVCSAAVQMGLITLEEGGEVTIEIAAGLDAYEGGTANGVTSLVYGPWDGSFVFPDAPPESVTFEVTDISWDKSAKSLGLAEGDSETVECAKGGSTGAIWGSGPYTADTSVCTAGVHAGVITVADGGEVTITVSAGEDSYEGTTANGVTSAGYGPYDLSFTVDAA